MTRSRLSLESLDARTLPSAVLTLPDHPAALAAQHADEAPGQADGLTENSAGKVSMQDFSFVIRVSKASPDLN